MTTHADMCALTLLARLYPQGFYLFRAAKPEIGWLPFGRPRG